MAVTLLCFLFSVFLQYCILSTFAILTGAQEPQVVTTSGPVKGKLVYNLDAKVAVATFLGIPYAQAPIERLRFAPPIPHGGFRSVHYATKFAPACPQPHLVLFPSVNGVLEQSEDCLHLNIWVSEIVMSYTSAPVLVLFEGEHFAAGATNRIPGHDLAAFEHLVVVSVGYRLNIFGFLCFENSDARGNLGLLDQYLALVWIRDNIARFGGNKDLITIMGHSSGAASVMYHLVSPKTAGFFQRAIIMSGAIPEQNSGNNVTVQASYEITASLGCSTRNDSRSLLRCLRNKSAFDLLRAFEVYYRNQNWTDSLLPVVDSFLPPSEQYVPKSPQQAVKDGSYRKIPILTGIVTFDGVVALSRWPDLLNQGYFHLYHLFLDIIAPTVMTQSGFTDNIFLQEVPSLIEWQYLTGVKPGDSTDLLNRMLKFYTDVHFKAPHYQQLSLLSAMQDHSIAPVYAYEFAHGGLAVYSRVFNITGPGHGEELIYLFGPSLMRNILGRGFEMREEKVSSTMKRIWSDFARNGFLHTKSYDYGNLRWRPYQIQNTNHLVLKGNGGQTLTEDRISPSYYLEIREQSLSSEEVQSISLWNDFLPKFYNKTVTLKQEEEKKHETISTGLYLQTDQPYRSAMYTLIGFVIVLLSLLVVCVILLKRTTAERDHSFF